MTDPVDPTLFREVMGALVTGVTVIAAVDPATGTVHGMTANAFMSVSLSPPLVVVGVGRAAHLHRILEQGRTFGVSILRDGQEALAVHMAGRSREGLSVEFGQHEAGPVLTDCLASLSATIFASVVAGDHTLVIGEITHLKRPHPDARALAFHKGKLSAFDVAQDAWHIDIQNVWAGSFRSSWG